MKSLFLATALETANGFGTSFGMQSHALHAAMNDTLHNFGTDMKISTGVEQQFPMNENELRAQGWSKYSTVCDPLLGWSWSLDKGVSEKKPITLYTTAGGQISGIGMRFYGDVKQQLIDA